MIGFAKSLLLFVDCVIDFVLVLSMIFIFFGFDTMYSHAIFHIRSNPGAAVSE